MVWALLITLCALVVYFAGIAFLFVRTLGGCLLALNAGGWLVVLAYWVWTTPAIWWPA